MASAPVIENPPRKAITLVQELALAHAVHAKAGTQVTRERLARMLLLDDRHEEVIGLLETATGRSLGEELMLADSYLARETEEDSALAHDAASRAVALADSDILRAHALATLGKCETRLGRRDAALATLGQALAFNPHNKDACKRIAALEVASGGSAQVLALTEELFAKGVGHARLFGAQVLAHACAGDLEAARRAEGFDLLHRRQMLAPPAGWDSVEAFNAALSHELIAHPDTRFERYGSASALTWRVENPGRADTPLFNALVEQIKDALAEHIAAADRSGHRWATFRPDPARLRIWCVITEGDGHETWHVHQFGWLSGVYYAKVPEAIARGTDRKGCLSFGLPEDVVGEATAAAFGERIVRPEEGMLLTFPSHLYHRTYPHGGEGKRICVAFDLQES